MRTTIPSYLRLFRQFLLLGFLLTPVMAVGQSFEVMRSWAEEGNPAFQNILGNMYADGEGVPEDDAEAVKWYRLAADQGHALTQVTLGTLYDQGIGVSENNVEAVKWFRLAADQGLTRAQTHIGTMYILGHGVPMNLVLAYAWFNVAAASESEDTSTLKTPSQFRSDITPLMTPA